MSSIVSRAEAHAADVLHAWTTRGMLSGAYSFKAFLARLPDKGPSVTRWDIEQISTIAAKVISHIDARLDERRDAHETQLEFASLIYRIQARLEELVRWGKHLPA